MKFFCLVLGAFLFFTSGCGKPLKPTYSGYQNIRVEKVGLRENIIAGEIKLFNPNTYALQVKSADLDLYLNDKFSGNTRFDTLITLPPKEHTIIPLRLKTSAKNVLRNAGRILFNPDVKIRIEGNVKAGRKGFFINVPINYEGVKRIDLL